MAFLGPSLRRRRVAERPGLRVAAAVVLSLVLNAVLVLVITGMGAFDLAKPVRPAAVALAPLSSDQWSANRAIGGVQPPSPAPHYPLPLAPPPTPPPVEVEKKLHGQIVDVAPSKDNRAPKDARFLSDRDNTVEKETRSRWAGTKAFDNTLPTPSDGAKKRAEPKPEAGEGGLSQRSAPGREGPKAGGDGGQRLAIPKQPAQERLALAPRMPGEGSGLAVAPHEDQQRVAGTGDDFAVPGKPGRPGTPGTPGTGDGGDRRQGIDPRLLPDPQSLARIAGGPAPDRLEGIDEGEATALNTHRFKYATFFNRVGEAIYHEWDPNRAYEVRDPDRRMFPVRDYTTIVEVLIDGSGNLSGIRLLRGCGLDFLDEELLRAIRKAAPFPNPPTGMVEGDGRIHVSLAYTLLQGSGPRMQIMAPRGLGDLPSSLQQPYPQH
ncbi:MAG TPA: TonB family protein [Anaeromyxobacter sp.]|nr:TonB family protein [Anaeromyxobacter sp.]